MNIAADILPWPLIWLSWGVLFACLSVILPRAPWNLLRHNGLESVWVGGVGCVGLAWSMQAGIHPGLELHLLGVTALTLVFGPCLAIAGGILSLAGVTALGLYDWPAFAVNGLLLAILPVLVSVLVGRLVFRLLPHNLFIYVFLTGFFGAMAAMAVVITISAALLLAIGAYPMAIVSRDYLAMMPLMMFPEGFITGMLITMLVVYRPSWVRTFDDRDYIIGK